MLQLGGALACAAARRSPRVSPTLWMSAQHLLSASSTAANPNPELDTANVPTEKSTELKKEPQVHKEVIKSKSLVTATFKSLSISSNQDASEKTKELNDKIKAATNLDEILVVTEDPNFNKQNAAALIPILYNWISSSKIKMSDLQKSNRYWKAYHMLGLNRKPSMFWKNNDDPLVKILHSDTQVEKIKNLNVYQMITILSNLANKAQRQIPVLEFITKKIINSSQELNIKLLADILYSVSVLTYYNPALMEKISSDLLKIIPNNENSAVIGSILKSIGVLRYRDEPLLDSLSTWIVDHCQSIRPQEINNLLMSLALLGYAPKNMNELLQHVIRPLKESDMCNSSEWLDVIWALTILNHAVPEQYESILNSNFLSRLFDESELSVSKSLKVLNVNAAARLLPGYKGPLLPEDSSFFETTISRSKEKVHLANSIISALKILSPSDSYYLNTNVNTKMGFLLDAEFWVDSNCKPILMSANSSKNKDVFRIAILTCSYHDFSRGVTEVTGPMKFYCKLLKQQDYKTMLISYTDVNTKDKLIQRVQYINDNIKKLVADALKK